MVAILLIGAGLLVAMLIAGRPIAEGFNRLTKSDAERAQNLQNEQFEYQKSKLSAFDNFVRTVFTGYGDLNGGGNTPNRETVNAVKTEGRSEGLQDYRPTATTRNYRRRHWTR